MEDKQNLVEIHVIIASEDEASKCTVTGPSNKILCALSVILYKVAIDSGYTVEDLLEVLEKSFTDFEEKDKIEEA